MTIIYTSKQANRRKPKVFNVSPYYLSMVIEYEAKKGISSPTPATKY